MIDEIYNLGNKVRVYELKPVFFGVHWGFEINNQYTCNELPKLNIVEHPRGKINLQIRIHLFTSCR